MTGHTFKPHIVTDDGVEKKPQLGKTSAFLQIWSELTCHTDKPRYKDLLPEDLPNQLWRNLFITSIVAAPFTVTFQYQGMYITDQLGQHFAGKELSEELFGEALGEIERLYQLTWKEQKPVLSRELMTSRSGISTLNEVIHVPLFDSTGKVSHICGVIESVDIPETPLDENDDIPQSWRVEFSGIVDL
ncbi:PAS domain-containing protein [Curvivirga aplysinae]|uniref:PAS domain-containing protein n=1 Tax=Curvivirga aplysinae TaxID=2529852 RepID=UPI0012BD5598|nr:PAS domain-containing protein [Curvivirga aplysinae]MTI09712.1 PAS domain-containing protein [Curvivirga aplysinae]